MESKIESRAGLSLAVTPLGRCRILARHKSRHGPSVILTKRHTFIIQMASKISINAAQFSALKRRGSK